MDAARLVNAPNAVSLLRLPLALAFWLVPAPALRIAILIVAAASDWFDGWLARRRGGSVPGGELVDPIFDKLFILAVVAVLLVEGRLSLLEVGLVVLRDVLVLAGAAALLAAGIRARLRARMRGKLVTALQIATLIAAITLPAAVLPMAALTAAAGIAAAIDYAHAAKSSLHRSARDE